MTIVIADDYAQNREFLRTVIESCGYIAVEAANGREAVERLRESGADAVILDLQMPEMDGYEAIAEIRRDPAFTRLPAVALTAYAMDHDRQRAAAAGFNAFWTKPISVAKLRVLLRELAESSTI